MTSRATIRAYRPADEPSWLECRLLSFFGGSYFDDVKRAKEVFDVEAVELVAVDDRDRVLALVDVEVDGALATIDTIAVRPDARRAGLAGRLLERALGLLPEDVTTVDAWTREDEAANAWYRALGFVVEERYLHVYKDWDESADGFETPDGLSRPVKAFLHAPMAEEARMRARFRRVHECRRYVRPR